MSHGLRRVEDKTLKTRTQPLKMALEEFKQLRPELKREAVRYLEGLLVKKDIP